MDGSSSRDGDLMGDYHCTFFPFISCGYLAWLVIVIGTDEH